MAALTVTAANVAPVSFIDYSTGPAGEAITAGQVVRHDATSGKYVLANGTGAATVAGPLGIAITGGATNTTISVLHKGIIDFGGDVLDGPDFGDPIYAGNAAGQLNDAAGSVSTVVGRVVPGWGSLTADKLLRLDL